MLIEFLTRGLIVALGVPFLMFLPRAMFWPTKRHPYGLLLLICVELLVVSLVLGAIYAHQKKLPLVPFGSPLRVLALIVGWAYLLRARVAWKQSDRPTDR